MTDVMQAGLAWLRQQRKAHMSRAITYRRGAASITITATPGRSTFEVDDRAGGFVQVRTHDELFDAADFYLDGKQAEPLRGDQIEVRHGDTVTTYEVSAPGGNQPWQWADPYQTVYRVHTNLIDGS